MISADRPRLSSTACLALTLAEGADCFQRAVIEKRPALIPHSALSHSLRFVGEKDPQGVAVGQPKAKQKGRSCAADFSDFCFSATRTKLLK